MRKTIVTLIVVLLISMVPALAKEKKETTGAEKNIVLPVFKPKNLGAPKMRVGGGSRGQTSSAIELYVLAPEQLGFTTQSQPKFYWYVSKDVKQPIEITLFDKLSVLLKIKLDNGVKAGIQTLNLIEHNAKLLPDVKYKWSVSIINDPKQRSADIFSSAGVMLIPETDGLKTKLATTDFKNQALIYAKEGIWYDALASIQNLAENCPTETISDFMRTELLQQVGIYGIH